MDNEKLTTELFVLPHGDEYIIYAPLKHLAFIANAAAVKVLHELQQGKEIEKDDNTKALLNRFETMGIVNGPPDIVPPKPAEREFAPTTVTLFPTSDCNLRCVYCYASAGENPRYMPWEMAKAAIDLVICNARAKQSGVDVGFHGNGEPTLPWKLFTRCVTYAREAAQKHNLELRTYSATNGVLTEKQVEWIIANMCSLNVSLDGQKDIQDRQRPTVNGRGSFDRVFATVKQLDEASFPYGIRATITTESVRRMTEMVYFFHDNFSTKHLHFEPLFVCGRCEYTSWDAPPMNVFVEEFIKANDVAETLGIKLFVSGMRLDTITGTFCGAAAGTFAVTPEGYVTSCFEVTSPADPYAELFFTGKFDEASGKFIIFQDKFAYLRNLTVHNIEYCADCFCKWHCAGDCPRKASAPYDFTQRRGSARCQIAQELTKYQLLKLLSQSEGEYIKEVKYAKHL